MKRILGVTLGIFLVAGAIYMAPQVDGAQRTFSGTQTSNYTHISASGNVQLGDNVGNDTIDVSGVLEVDSTFMLTGQGVGAFIIAATDTASDDDYLIATNADIGTIQTGQMIMMLATTANTGACTMTFGTNLASKALKNTDVADPATNDILAGDYVFLYYDGTQYIILNPAGGTP